MNMKGVRTMSTTVSATDRDKVLSELEQYYVEKAAAVAAKRNGHSKSAQPREVSIEGSVSLMIDPRQRKVILSWDK
jgi:hypothetical protein